MATHRVHRWSISPGPRFVALLLVVAASVLDIGPLSAATNPAAVYLYNSAGRDGFDYNCHGWVWHKMGFLDAAGHPATEQGNNLVVQGQVVGTVLGRDAQGRANRYASSDGTKEAYDLARGATTLVAYQRLKDANDRLIACTHGQTHIHHGGVGHPGGAIHLDANASYLGFGQGTNTGMPGMVPYALPAPPGAQLLRATLYGCWCGRDPDGPDKPEISVAASLEAIIGNGTVTAFPGRVAVSLGFTADANWAKLHPAAAAARRATGTNGNGNAVATDEDVANWLTDTPLFDRAGKIRAAGVDPSTIKLEYPDPEGEPVGAAVNSGATCPLLCVDGACAMTFEDASLTVPAGALSGGYALFDLHALDAIAIEKNNVALRRPGVPDSMVVDTGAQASLAVAGRLTLPYFLTGSDPHVYRLDSSVWTEVTSDRVVDTDAQTVSVSISTTGSFAAFSKTVCDVVGNNDGVNAYDIQAIIASRSQDAAAGDRRDADGDGKVTVNDARICALACTKPLCAP